MNITVNIDEVTLDTAVAEIVRYDSEDEEYVKGHRTVADIVAEQITAHLIKDEQWRSLRERMFEIRKEVIREALVPVVEKALSESFQKTNSYGEPIGQQVSMREVIADEARKMLTQPADSYNREKGTVLQVMVRKEVEAALGTEIRDAVKKAREQVSTEIGQMVATAVQAGLKGHRAMTVPTRLDIRHLRRHALKAIAGRRLGVSADSCILGIARDDDGAVIIHVNSGGNTCAVEQWLNCAGYRAEYLPFDPDVYGGKVRVTLREAIAATGAIHAKTSNGGGR